MAISSLVPWREAERVLLEELQKEGRPIKTGELTKRAIARFPTLTPEELQRRTPSGTKWWAGYFRFVLNLLRKKGETRRPAKGYWEVTKLGGQRLTASGQLPHPQEPKLSVHEKELLDLFQEILRSIENGEITAIITTKRDGFTVELGEHIKETMIILGRR